jgi:type I restriction enzyme S subunit
MTLPRYAKYKDSGVPWLGEVPEHWDVLKFRHVFTESPEKIENDVVGVMLSVSGYRGIEIKDYGDENRRRSDEDLVGYRVVRPGQLVVNTVLFEQSVDELSEVNEIIELRVGRFPLPRGKKSASTDCPNTTVNTMWLNYAGLGVSDFEGHVSPAYRCYFIDGSFDKRFTHHMMRCGSFVLGYTKFLTGIRPNSLQMSRDDLMAFQLLNPPLAEQSAIASFLDHETGKIDELIAEQERLLALLAEKRQATISHAVTKGLNPDAPMKDSGVEWLGEVPGPWGVVLAKRISSIFVPQRNKPELKVVFE